MKILMLGLAVAMSVTAQAQTSTTSLPASSSTTTATAASPDQTIKTSVKEEENSLRKKLSVNAYMGLSTDAAPANNPDTRKSSEIYSENYLQLGYKLSETDKISLRHNFAWLMSGESNGQYTMIDPAIIYSHKGPKLGGFEPMAQAYTFYVPVSETSRNDHRLGTLRADLSADYNWNTKLTTTVFTSPRLTLNTSANPKAAGSDSLLRIIAGLANTYNFSDTFNVYYSPYIDVVTSDWTRGSLKGNLPAGQTAMKAKSESWNYLLHEVGMGVNLTKQLSVTPAVINYVSMNTGEGFGREDMLEYDLYVTAAF